MQRETTFDILKNLGKGMPARTNEQSIPFLVSRADFLAVTSTCSRFKADSIVTPRGTSSRRRAQR